MTAGRLQDKVSFDAPVAAPDGYGGVESGWAEQFACRAEFIYSRGSEGAEAARLEGRAAYKVRIRQSGAGRTITTGWRLRDARRGTVYNIREVDFITDRAFIWLVAESGVAA